MDFIPIICTFKLNLSLLNKQARVFVANRSSRHLIILQSVHTPHNKLRLIFNAVDSRGSKNSIGNTRTSICIHGH